MARRIATKYRFYVRGRRLLELAVRIKTYREEKVEYQTALRQALDDCGMSKGSMERIVYREIVCSFFGTHGGRKTAQNRKASRGAKPQPKPRQKKTTSRVEWDKNGQSKWQM